MQRVLLIGSSTTLHSRQLLQAATGKCEIDTLPFGQIAACCGLKPGVASGVGGMEAALQAYDQVLVRAMPRGTLEQIIFRMDALGIFEQRGSRVINSPKSLEIAIDKFLCLARLEQTGLPVPPTVTCQTADQALEAFDHLNRDVVVKPLFGGEGKGLMRLAQPEFAERVLRWLESIGAVIYLQQFVEHPQQDFRVLVIGDELFAIRRYNHRDWKMNCSRGANVEAVELESRQRELALAAAEATGARIAGVDLLRDESGRDWLLEVNAVPGWQAVAAAHQINIADRIMQWVLNT